MNKQLRTHIYTLTAFAVILGVMILWQIVSGTTKQKGSSGGGTAGVADGRELVDAKDKAAAARELGRKGNSESVPYLIAYLKDPDPNVRIAVTDALGTIGEKRSSLDLILRLENESHTQVRAAIVRALGKLGKPDAIPKIVRRVDDPDFEVRLAAVEALANWNASNAILGIAHATSDTNMLVRAAAGTLLAKFGPASIDPLLEVMDEGNDGARVLRIKTIAGVDGDRAVPALLTILRAHAGVYPPTETPVRKAAIEALISRGEPAALALVPVISEPGNLALKSAAVQIFGKLKSPAGINAVSERLLSWKSLSSAVEWRMWTGMLKTMDSPLAREALTRLDTHYAAIAGKLPDVPAIPNRTPIPPRKPIDPSGYTGELSLLLNKPKSNPSAKGINLDLEFSAESGVWERVWGCNSYNRGIHEGLVMEVKTAPDSFDIVAGVLVGDDPWVKGGFADLRLKVKRPSGGRGPVEGTYEGTYRGLPISGPVTGDERPRRPVVVKDYVPFHPDEHPRLLFRQHELAAVRKRAATPFGVAYQEACSKSADPLNHAIMYQITGDRNFADSSKRLVEAYGEEIEALEGGSGSGSSGHRLVRVMLSYDLCYDAWPEAFKKQIRDRLRVTMPVIQNYIAIVGANYHPCCNYYGPGRGGPAIAALALLGEKGEKPPPPPDPFSRPSVVLPAEDYTPSPDTPVVDLAVGKLAERWLFAGPSPFALAPAAEETLMKLTPLRPQPGTTRKSLGLVTEQEGTNDVTRMAESVFMFTALPKEMIKDGAVDFASQRLSKDENAFLLSTVVKVSQDTKVSVVLDGASSVWLNGTKLDPDGCCLLKPGVYPMTAVCTVQGDLTRFAPRLVSPDSPEMSVRRASHRFQMALWQADCDEWERYGGADPLWTRAAAKGYWHMYAHYRVGIGDGGFQAETGSYADIASWFPLVYAGLSTRVFGRLPSPHNDVTHMVPRRMMAVHFPADGGAPFAQKLNSSHGLSAGHCAAIFPALPEQYRAPLLWGWNRVSGGAGTTSVTNLIDGTRDLWGTSLGAALMFLNYPLDMEPVEPAKAMPLTWEARTFGYYCFRSGWEGRDEFIAQVFLKAAAIGGWNDPNAGAFRLFGLGHEWVTGNQGKAGIRQFEPAVVLLPEWVEGSGTDVKKMKEDKRAVTLGLVLDSKKNAKPEQPKAVFAQNALSHLMYHKAELDGSGVVSLDYRDVYSAAQKGAKPSGVTGMRSISFDYGRSSGSPCLLTLVDKIEGDVDKVWLWPLPKGCLENTTVKGNTFIVKQGDATMKGTFLSPANVKIEATSENIVHLGARLFDKNLERIKAKGDGSFFVVITIQRGEGPEVTVKGTGLDACATVGNQTIRFDGTKVVLSTTK